MTLTLQCETCNERFTGGFGYSLLWSEWHTARHKQEAEARAERAHYIRKRARRAFGWWGMQR